jgi:hypothetical protein
MKASFSLAVLRAKTSGDEFIHPHVVLFCFVLSIVVLCFQVARLAFLFLVPFRFNRSNGHEMVCVPTDSVVATCSKQVSMAINKLLKPSRAGEREGRGMGGTKSIYFDVCFLVFNAQECSRDEGKWFFFSSCVVVLYGSCLGATDQDLPVCELAFPCRQGPSRAHVCVGVCMKRARYIYIYLYIFALFCSSRSAESSFVCVCVFVS